MTENGLSSYAFVCLSPQDWDVPLKTNRQRICMEAARRGHRVFFVETNGWLGTYLVRRGRSLTNALRRLLGTETMHGNVRVHHALNPLPLSWRFRTIAKANALIEGLLLRRLLRRQDANAHVTLVYDPRAIVTAERLGSAAIVYDCVDDYKETFPESYKHVVSTFDLAAGDRSTVVTATTQPLYERHRRRNSRTHLVPNVADHEHFASAKADAPAARARATRPTVGFVGNLLPVKVDFDLIAGVAAARPGWRIVIGGPAPAEAADAVAALERLPNVEVPGLVSYEELPSRLAQFDVGWIPYRRNAYTASVFPLKLYEYLAAGLGVVVSGVPSIPRLEPDVIHVEGVDETVSSLEAQLERRTPDDVERRRKLARQHTWSDRFDAILRVTAEALEETPA